MTADERFCDEVPYTNLIQYKKTNMKAFITKSKNYRTIFCELIFFTVEIMVFTKTNSLFLNLKKNSTHNFFRNFYSF